MIVTIKKLPQRSSGLPDSGTKEKGMAAPFPFTTLEQLEERIKRLEQPPMESGDTGCAEYRMLPAAEIIKNPVDEKLRLVRELISMGVSADHAADLVFRL